jgi:hypothetical protein
MRDYTTSLTQIKVKEHQRLYNFTHTNQSKWTWETVQHHSHKSKCSFTLICVSDVGQSLVFIYFDLCEWCWTVSRVHLLLFVWVMLYSLSCSFTLICVSGVGQSLMFIYFDLCEWSCIVSGVPLLWYVWVMLYSLSCSFTTQTKVKEHERLYNITHTYRSKGTWETIQHHSHKSK